MADIFRTISTKFYENRPGFVDDVIKNIWCVFEFVVPIAVHLQNAHAKYCSDIIQMSWKTFKLPYRKFIQDNVYQTLSELTGFYRRHYKNILVCFFSIHSVCVRLSRSCSCTVQANPIISICSP